MRRTIALLSLLALLNLSCDEEEKKPQQVAPTGPDLLAAIEITHSSVHLTWNDRSNNEEGFELEMSATGTWTVIDTLDVNVTETIVSGLSSGAPYRFRVFAFNNAGRSGASNIVDVTTTANNPPPAPTNIEAVALAPTVVRVTWSDTAPNPVVFVIDRRTASESWSRVGEAPDNSTAYNDSTCQVTSTYYYRVGARSGSLLTMSADSAGVTTPAVGTPFPPSNLAAAVFVGTGVRLTWVDNSLDETVFQIGRNIFGQPFGVVDSVPANTTEYFDSLGDAGAVYNYKVRAANAEGVSAWSNSVEADYRYCSNGTVPICVSNFWIYNVDPPSGPDYHVMRRIADVAYPGGVDFYLVVENEIPDTNGTDSLYYWRNFDLGLYQDDYPLDAAPAELLLRYPPSGAFWNFDGDSVLVTTSQVAVIVGDTTWTNVTIYQRFDRDSNHSIKYYLRPNDFGIIKEEEIEGSVIRTTRELVDWDIRN